MHRSLIASTDGLTTTTTANFIRQKYKTKQNGQMIESNQIKITSERLPETQLSVSPVRL